jgi:hypothetical protein
VNYRFVIEQTAAETIFALRARERRLLQTACAVVARDPHRTPDLEEIGSDGRRHLTRFFGPFSVTYWVDDAAKEVRIALIFCD